MEYVEGETLAQILARRRREHDTEPLDLADYANLARGFAAVADGLHHAHSHGVIHRDIKPSNLIREPDGRLRILDFGLATLEGERSLTLTGDLVGTPAYMSPEQANRRKITVDQRTDIYSLGATLYEMLTLEPPFRGVDYEETLSQIIEQDPRPPGQLKPRVPASLETIVLKCLRKDPAARYGTAEALAQDLRRFVRGDPVEARPEAPVEKLARRARRHKGKLVVTACAVVGLVVCGVLGYQLAVEAQNTAEREYNERVAVAVDKLLRGQTVLSTLRDKRGRVTAESLALRENYTSLRQSAEQLVEQTVRELQAATALRPESFEAYYYRARGLRLLGQDDEALEVIERCLALCPGFVPAQMLAGDLGDATPGETRGKVAWGATWAQAHNALRGQDWEAAVDAYDALLAVERADGAPLYLGSSIELLLGRGTAHLQLKNYASAQADFATAHYLWRDALEPALLLGKAYHLDGKETEADHVFEELVASYTPRDEARLWIAATYRRLDDPGRMVAWFRRIESPPEQAAYYVRFGWALLQDLWSRGVFQSSAKERSPPEATRELVELERVVEKAIELTPRSRAALALKGQMLEALGKFRKADESFRLAFRKKQEQPTGSSDMRGTGILAGGVIMSLTLVGTTEAQVGTWSAPKLVANVNSPFMDWGPALTTDCLELYFGSSRPPAAGGDFGTDLFVARRDNADSSFGQAIYVTELAAETAEDNNPNLSHDGLTLYFNSTREGGWGGFDIWKATRTELSAPFGNLTNAEELEGINSPADEGDLTISADGLTVVFTRGGLCCAGGDLYIASRDTVDESFRNPRHLAELKSGESGEINPNLSPDGLSLFFSEYGVNEGERRPGGAGNGDIWVARREARDQPFGTPQNLGFPVNTGEYDWSPFIHGNWPYEEATLYFVRCGPGCNDDASQIYQSTWTLTPPALRRFIRGDVNSDREFDLTDAVTVINNLFLGRGVLTCEKAADANDDGAVDVADPTYILNALFLGGERVPRPRLICSSDPTPDALVCESYPRCAR